MRWLQQRARISSLYEFWFVLGGGGMRIMSVNCVLSLSLSQITARLARPSRADDERAWESFAVCTLLSRKASNALRRRDTCGGTAPPPTPESRYACIWTPCALGACCFVSQSVSQKDRETDHGKSQHPRIAFISRDIKSRQKSAGV